MGSSTYTLSYDAENRLTGVSGVTTAYVGSHPSAGSGQVFEWTGSTSTMKKYYYAGGARVAMRQGSTLYWLLSDHLGSTAITANSGGVLSGELRYKPFGETRYNNGSTLTTFHYTGQREESGIGLYFYNARWYDPALGRFLSADTMVPDPQNPQSLNRYAYTLNNPVTYTDPTGHCIEGMEGYETCIQERDAAEELYGINITGKWTLDEMITLIEGLSSFAGMFNNIDAVQGILGGTTIERIRGWSLLNPLGQNAAANFPVWGSICFFDEWARNVWRDDEGNPNLVPVGTVVHELAHRWDNKHGGNLSSKLAQLINMRQESWWGPYTAGDIVFVTKQARDNPSEAWAASVAAYAVPRSPMFNQPNSPGLDVRIRNVIALLVAKE